MRKSSDLLFFDQVLGTSTTRVSFVIDTHKAHEGDDDKLRALWQWVVEQHSKLSEDIMESLRRSGR